MDLYVKQFSPPLQPANYYRRNRLNEFLKNNKICSLIIIDGPAGYGKTTLVSDFVMNEGPYLWINLYDDPINQNIFFETLLNAFTTLIDCSNTKLLFDSYLEKKEHTILGNHSIESLIISLLNEFNSSFKNHLNLVLDDLHVIGHLDWALFTLNVLLKNIPENLHLYITTRSIPDLDTNDLIESKMYAEINIHELTFTKEDIIGLFSASALPEKTLKNQLLNLDKFSGWITGINLSLGMIKKFDFNYLLPEDEYPENTFNNLSEKMFSKMNASQKQFLLLTSLIEHFDKELCEFALDIADFNNILTFFDINFSFIVKYENDINKGEIDSYRYINLMRNFLRAKALKEIDIKVLRNIYKRISDYLYNKNNITESLKFLELCNDYEILYIKLKNHYDTIYKSGRMDLIWRWLNLIKSNCTIQDPYLYYYLGALSRYYEKDTQNFRTYLDEAEKISIGSNDNKLILNIAVLKSDIYINNNEPEFAISILNDKTVFSGDVDDYFKIKYKLAFAYYIISDYNKSESIINEIINSRSVNTETNNYYDCFNLLGHINLIRGDFKAALNYYNKYFLNTENVIIKFETLCNLVLLNSQCGEKAKAEENLMLLNKLIGIFQIPVFKIPYLLSRQSFYFEAGDYSESITILNKIRKLAIENNSRRYIYLTARLLTDCYYYLGDMSKYLHYFEEASLLIDKSNELERNEFLVLEAIKLSKYFNNLNKAEKIYLDALEYFEKNNLLYSQSQILCHLSELYFQMENYDKSLKFFSEFYEILKEKGFKPFLLRELNMNKKFNIFLKKSFAEEKLNQIFVN